MEPMSLQIPTPAQAQLSADNRELISLLHVQNQMLDSLNKNLTLSMERTNDQRNSLRARVTDVDMSIGSMIVFMLKWFVASIPVAIIFGLIYALIAGVLMAGVRGLF